MNKILIDQRLREVHVTTKISEDPIESFDSTLPDYQTSKFEKVGKLGESLVRAIAEVNGVTEIFIKPYSITVDCGKAFDKEKVITEVVNLIASMLSYGKYEVEWEGREDKTEKVPEISFNNSKGDVVYDFSHGCSNPGIRLTANSPKLEMFYTDYNLWRP